MIGYNHLGLVTDDQLKICHFDDFYKHDCTFFQLTSKMAILDILVQGIGLFGPGCV